MIKLERHDSPDYLSKEKVFELTLEFADNGKNVWNHKKIKEALLLSSNNKCAYCECKIDIESNYLEVEHFEDKKTTPEKVVQWDNLLPSCKRCNGSKGSHNVQDFPIINPFDIDPRNHLEFKLYRLKDKTSLGLNTIDVLNLNHSERAVFKRFAIGEQVINAISNAWDRYHHWCENGNTTRAKNILIGGLEGLLLECQPNSSYSATASTVLHNEEDYQSLICVLKYYGLWTDDLEELHQKTIYLVLDCA